MSECDFTEQDARDTVNKGALHAMLMFWPKSRLHIASLGFRALRFDDRKGRDRRRR
ncbi:hypothetical protein J3E64_000940 [Sphingobium sp. OAS761]|nr:hypothetical protein [Sphingobium sp. OAS761]